MTKDLAALQCEWYAAQAKAREDKWRVDPKGGETNTKHMVTWVNIDEPIIGSMQIVHEFSCSAEEAQRRTRLIGQAPEMLALLIDIHDLDECTCEEQEYEPGTCQYCQTDDVLLLIAGKEPMTGMDGPSRDKLESEFWRKQFKAGPATP